MDHKDNISNYYGSSPKHPDSYIGNQKSLAGFIILVILLFLTIGLGILVLVVLVSQEGSRDSCHKLNVIYQKMSDQLNNLLEISQFEFQPKIHLITTILGSQFPMLAESLLGTLKDLNTLALSLVTQTSSINPVSPAYNSDFPDGCNYTEAGLTSLMNISHKLEIIAQECKSTSTPKLILPRHHNYYNDVNFLDLSRCIGKRQSSEDGFAFKTISTFVPAHYTAYGCTRHPVLNIGDDFFSYVHVISLGDCSYTARNELYFTIGVIDNDDNDLPAFIVKYDWIIKDTSSKQGCSLVNSNTGAWCLCSVVSVGFEETMGTISEPKIMAYYLGLDGRKVQWTLTKNDIDSSFDYASILLGKGRGVTIDNVGYLLVHGTLKHTRIDPPLCQSYGCTDPSLDICYQAQKPARFNYKPYVNGILSFNLSHTKKPVLIVRLLDPSNIWTPGEGSLYQNRLTKLYYIQIYSQGWRSLPQVGVISLTSNLAIEWSTHKVLSRPGPQQCDSRNRCPKICNTSTSIGYYPLAIDYSSAIGLSLLNPTYLINPWLQISNGTHINYAKQVYPTNQESSSTYTHCFDFRKVTWCVTLAELKKPYGNFFMIEPITYILYPYCDRSRASY